MTHPTRLVWIATLIVIGANQPVLAQQMRPVDGRQFPLNQESPVGMAGQWALMSGRIGPYCFQPVRVILPADGQVTFYQGTLESGVAIGAPAQASLLVGRTYRLKLADVTGFPGVEFYPSVELIDRLHPPPGQEHVFPVELPVTEDELHWAAQGRMITKVIYLEQPDRVLTQHLNNGGPRVTDLEPSQNTLAEADSLGRPIAILRMGGRTPDPNRPEPMFYGPGGPVQLGPQPADAVPPKLTSSRSKPRLRKPTEVTQH